MLRVKYRPVNGTSVRSGPGSPGTPTAVFTGLDQMGFLDFLICTGINDDFDSVLWIPSTDRRKYQYSITVFGYGHSTDVLSMRTLYTADVWVENGYEKNSF